MIDLVLDGPETTHVDQPAAITLTGTDLDVAWEVTAEGGTAVDADLSNEGGEIAFPSAGSYTVTSSVTDELGRTFSASHAISVWDTMGLFFQLPEFPVKLLFPLCRHDADFSSLADKIPDISVGDIIIVSAALIREFRLISPQDFHRQIKDLVHLLLQDGLHQKIQRLSLKKAPGVGGLSRYIHDLKPPVLQAVPDEAPGLDACHLPELNVQKQHVQRISLLQTGAEALSRIPDGSFQLQTFLPSVSQNHALQLGADLLPVITDSNIVHSRTPSCRFHRSINAGFYQVNAVKSRNFSFLTKICSLEICSLALRLTNP